IGFLQLENPAAVFRRNLSTQWLATFGYCATSAILLATLLRAGSVSGYAKGAMLCALSLAMADSFAGRRLRRFLEVQLSDADRFLIYSRSVEGVVHNVRNHAATLAGYLDVIDLGGDPELAARDLGVARQ